MRLSCLLKCLFIGLYLLVLLPDMNAQGVRVDSIKQAATDSLKNHDHLFSDKTVSIRIPDIIVTGIGTVIQIELAPALQEVARMEVEVNGEMYMVAFVDRKAEIPFTPDGSRKKLVVRLQEYRQEILVSAIPLWLSILPPLLAILLALIFKEVIVSLFIGTFVGAAIIKYYIKGALWEGIGSGLLEVIDTYFLRALYNPEDPGFGHISIIVFSLLIGGVVSIISRNGGMQGIVNRISAFARTPKSGQFATWLLGVAIFFDDYANTLVVGNTMRSVTDRLKISREKLAYLVDSTAAPVAALAFITTWIGAELGYIETGISQLEGFSAGTGAYAVFLNSLAYSFYPVLTLVFMLLLIYTGRDFGPMFYAEERARTTGELGRFVAGKSIVHADDLESFKPVEGAKPRSFNAIIPIVVLIAGVLIGLISTGMDASKAALIEKGIDMGAQGWGDTWRQLSVLSGEAYAGFFRKLGILIGNSDSYFALLWASLSAVIVAVVLTVSQRIMKLNETIDAMTDGFKSMFGAIVILVLAWSLALVTEDMETATFLTRLMEGRVSIVWVPAITFILGAAVAFSTGSSWGTMAILYPVMIAASWQLSMSAGLPEAEALAILYNVVSAVLAGSVLGDHCSPISDTTILSSLATSCNHIDHVRTQLPYALTVGTVGTLLGTLPASMGVPAWITFPLCIGALVTIIRLWGRRVEGQTIEI